MFRSVEFRHPFPNEWEFDANGNPIAPGARELAEAVIAALRRRVSETTPIEQHSFYGWGFRARFDGCWFGNILNPFDDRCVLTVSLDWYWLRVALLRRPGGTFDRYCAALESALGDIPGVIKGRPAA